MRIGDLELEFAYGGHHMPRVTGVFALPAPAVHVASVADDADAAGANASVMQGVRFRQLIRLGPAFGPEWRKMRRKERLEAAAARASTADLDPDDSVALLPNAASPSYGSTSSQIEDDWCPPTTRDEVVTRVLELIADLKERWLGVDYNLLSKNCNSFSSTLAYQLTGRHPPGPSACLHMRA